jgi:putative Mn2+ efflux pump MntP
LLAHVASLLVLAFAVSVDGFGVGVTYGLRRIRIPLLSVLIIACCSGLVIFVSMQAGSLLTLFLPEFVSRLIGACVLMLIGAWALLQLRKGRQSDERRDADGACASQESHGLQTSAAGTVNSVNAEAVSGNGAIPVTPGAKPSMGEISSAALVVMVELKRLGLVIQILRTPQAADVDKSGVISSSEAVMLGVALSLDAFGAGLGAAMLGLPALLTSLTIAVASAMFLLGGMRFGFRFSAWRGMQALSFLPGILLIVMGIMKLL